MAKVATEQRSVPSLDSRIDKLLDFHSEWKIEILDTDPTFVVLSVDGKKVGLIKAWTLQQAESEDGPCLPELCITIGAPKIKVAVVSSKDLESKS